MITLLNLIVFLTAVSAFADGPALDSWAEEKKAIQADIIRANRMDLEIGKAKDRLLEATAQNARPEIIRQLNIEVEREKEKQLAAYTKALHRTMAACELAPGGLKGTSVMPATQGRVIQWIPVAREFSDHELENARGVRTRVPNDRKRKSAKIYVDGVTYFDPHTIRTASVGWLAATLLHERTHFEQMTTPGRGDVLSESEMEKEGYKAARDNMSAFFDSTNPREAAEMQLLDGYYREAEDAVNQEIEARKGIMGAVRRILPPAKRPTMFDTRLHSDSELSSLKNRADRFDVEVREESDRLIEKAREQAEREALRTYRPAVPTVPSQAPAIITAKFRSPFASSYPGLSAFATESCNRPGHAEFPDMGRGTMSHTEYFSDEKGDLHWFHIEYLSLKEGCPRELFTQLEYMARTGELGKVHERGWIEQWVNRRYPQSSGGGGGRNRGDSDGGGSKPGDPDHGKVWDRVNPIIRR